MFERDGDDLYGAAEERLTGEHAGAKAPQSLRVVVRHG